MEEEQASNNLVVLMLYSTNSIKITEIHRHGDMFYSSCDIRSIGLNLTLLKGGMYLDEKEIYEICMSVDSFIAAELTESIVCGTSYDMLEAHYGILPISKRHFYRKKEIIEKRTTRLVEEKNGQYMIVWGGREFFD